MYMPAYSQKVLLPPHIQVEPCVAIWQLAQDSTLILKTKNQDL